MNTIELQNSIIKKILDLKDLDMLQILHNILESKEKDEVYQLSELEIQILNESLSDYKNGNYSTHEEVKTRIEKWLEK